MSSVKFTLNDVPDLSDQIILVTGGNSGLGLETIRQLRRHNPKCIYLAARSKEKSEAAIKALQESEPDASLVHFLELDLASFLSVTAAAETFLKLESRLDILINNAGIMTVPEGLTKDGYEIQFGTNILGPALFTQLLLPLVEKSTIANPQARIVLLTSGADQLAPKTNPYKFDELKTTMPQMHTATRYGVSKLGNIHYAAALAERYPGIKVVSVHPGIVNTSLHHNTQGWFLKPLVHLLANTLAMSVEKGVLSQLWASVSPDVKSGEFYHPIGLTGKGSPMAQNHELQEEFYKWTQEQISPFLPASTENK